MAYSAGVVAAVEKGCFGHALLWREDGSLASINREVWEVIIIIILLPVLRGMILTRNKGCVGV